MGVKKLGIKRSGRKEGGKYKYAYCSGFSCLCIFIPEFFTADILFKRK